MFQPNGNTLNYFYDKLDRIEQLSDNMGVIAKYTYDGNGNQLTVTDGLDRAMTYTYDALNRKTSEALPSGATTTYEYDGNSNLLTVKDAKGNSTSYTYSSLNQQLTHTDALNAKTVFEYDANGNLSKATDAKGNATSYTYDALNRNTIITFANGASLQYGYDELGNVVASKDRAGNEFKYTYNPLGNLLSKVYPDGTSDKYTYDRISRMLSAINKDATVNFTYDRAGRLLSETLNGKVTGYSYNVAAGKRTLTYPSGMKVEEHLNARDLISSIFQNGEEVVTMEYNVTGQKTKQTYANGITTEYGYNENGWLSSIKDDHDILNYDMTYDAVGNMTKRKDLLNAERTESYGYDVISQLTSFKRGTTVDRSYEFDLLGNRIKTLENGVVTNYTSNNVNAYTNITGGLNFTPQYDGNGNMLNDDKHTYAYDFSNKLVSVDQTVGTYKYDALGRRIAKSNTLFYYSDDLMVEEVTGDVTTSYLYGNNIDETLQMKRGNDAYYYHTNHIGSTMALSDANGQLIESIDYDICGKPIFSDAKGNALVQSFVSNPILYTGREYDYESGIYYYRARSQHISIGRFMQKDLLHYIDGLNDYTYVLNNSVNAIDPMGLFCISIPVEDICHYTGNYYHKRGWHCGWHMEYRCFPGSDPGPYESPCEKFAKEIEKDCENDPNLCNCKAFYEGAKSRCENNRKKEFENDYKIWKQRGRDAYNNRYRNNNYNSNNNRNTNPQRDIDMSKYNFSGSQYERIQQENYVKKGGRDLEGYKKYQKMSQQEKLDYSRQHPGIDY